MKYRYTCTYIYLHICDDFTAKYFPKFHKFSKLMIFYNYVLDVRRNMIVKRQLVLIFKIILLVTSAVAE